MCGIVGSASTTKKIDKEWLRSASKALYHRGPDDHGKWISDNYRVGLAHRRLSIIDVTKNASQPFVNHTNDAVIIFNGEIYNYLELRSELKETGYIFKSNSDTEVLLNSYHKWGYNCLKKINGIFSFVIYDIIKKKIFAARDICGQKPFYYTFTNDTLYFASEIKSLIINKNIGSNISLDSVDFYLATGHTSSSNSIFKNVNKLKPSQALSFDLFSGELKTWTYWEPPNLSNLENKSTEIELIEKLESTIEAAVVSQLRSDVPLGLCLSGGLDSSLITAIAAKHVPKISTFTAIFPGYNAYDESKFARIIANEYSTSHNEINLNYPSPDVLSNLTDYYDEPLADSSSIATFLLFEELSKFCKVALGGDGSDELFGGYSHHLPHKYKLSKYIPSKISKNLYNKLLKYFPIGLKGRNLSYNLFCQESNLIPSYPYIFDFITRSQLLSNHINYQAISDNSFCYPIEIGSEITSSSMKNDFLNYLSEDILVKTDRASMGNSLEIRSPFLDKPLIEFSFKYINPTLKASNNTNKVLLKKLASKILPSSLKIERKQGFSVPLSSWLKTGPFRDFIYEVLMDRNCFFNKKAIREILKNQDKGFSNSERIYSLVMFELWRRKYV